jgi:hypothetical protein
LFNKEEDMASRNVVETVHGKLSKYEVVKSEGGLMSAPSFAIYKNGAYFKGSYDSLAKAVEAAKASG